MKKLRFQGVPHAPSLVLPHAVADGAEPSVKPWKPGEVREVSDAAAARVLADYATVGHNGAPAFTEVDPVVTKPEQGLVTKK